MPVGTAFRPALRNSSVTRCGDSGVAMSMSRMLRPTSASRTQPPTKRASSPSAVSARITSAAGPSVIQGCGSRCRSGFIQMSQHFDQVVEHARGGAPDIIVVPGVSVEVALLALVDAAFQLAALLGAEERQRDLEHLRDLERIRAIELRR